MTLALILTVPPIVAEPIDDITACQETIIGIEDSPECMALLEKLSTCITDGTHEWEECQEAQEHIGFAVFAAEACTDLHPASVCPVPLWYTQPEVFEGIFLNGVLASASASASLGPCRAVIENGVVVGFEVDYTGSGSVRGNVPVSTYDWYIRDSQLDGVSALGDSPPVVETREFGDVLQQAGTSTHFSYQVTADIQGSILPDNDHAHAQMTAQQFCKTV